MYALENSVLLRFLPSSSAWGAVLLLGVIAQIAWAEQHPIYTAVDRARAADYEAAVQRVMAMSEDEFLDFLPDKNRIPYCECPNCYGGSEGGGIFTWSLDRPNQLVCRHCGLVLDLPDARYPEAHVLSGQNALGETVEFPYYLNEQNGAKHYLSSHLSMYRRAWLEQQCIALGQAYHATGKPEYARRVVLVLDKAARLYPHYPVVHSEHPRNVRFADKQEPPYTWDAGRWSSFHNEIPRSLLLAYDLVYDSDQFEVLSRELGYDIRARLEMDFLRPTFRAVELSGYHVSNVVGYQVTTAAMLGRVIGDPNMVHRAFGWIMQNLDEGFFFDGTWPESPSYHYMTLGGLRHAFSMVKGYSDPPGYVDAIDGTRFDDLNPDADIPFWVKVQDAYKVIDFPNGCSPPVHDTWGNERRSAPRTHTVSTILPGYGHAALGWGSGSAQMQAHLHFSGAYGHSHRDTLSMSLWAREREMLSDLGYTWTDIRWWNSSTIAHNLVAVDRQEQRGRPADGDLLAFFPSDDGISVVEADGARAYSNIEGLDTYRRLLALIPVTEGNAYVLDISRTRGGSMHDWLLHGSADDDMSAECSLATDEATAGFAGEQPPETYKVWRNVKHAAADGNVNITFRYDDRPERGARIHLLGTEPTEVYLGETPSVRRAGTGQAGDNRKILDFWMPHLAARRTGEAPLQTLFAVVEEPFDVRPFIDSVRHLDISPAGDDCVAMEVTCGATTDTIIVTTDEEPFPERTAGDVTLAGRLGIVRRTDGAITGMWLFDGRELSAGGHSLALGAAAYTGTIEAAPRIADGAANDAFITDADLPPGDTLHGTWMIVTHGNGFRHGYEIDRVEQADGKTVIILTNDHGLRIEGSTTSEAFFPRRVIEGTNTFRIPTCASIVR